MKAAFHLARDGCLSLWSISRQPSSLQWYSKTVWDVLGLQSKQCGIFLWELNWPPKENHTIIERDRVPRGSCVVWLGGQHACRFITSSWSWKNRIGRIQWLFTVQVVFLVLAGTDNAAGLWENWFCKMRKLKQRASTKPVGWSLLLLNCETAFSFYFSKCPLSPRKPRSCIGMTWFTTKQVCLLVFLCVLILGLCLIQCESSSWKRPGAQSSVSFKIWNISWFLGPCSHNSRYWDPVCWQGCSQGIQPYQPQFHPALSPCFCKSTPCLRAHISSRQYF